MTQVRRLTAVVLIVAGALASVAFRTTLALLTDAPVVGSNELSTATLLPPAGLSAASGCALLDPVVTLTWEATGSAFADGYDVYRGTTSGGPYGAVGHADGRLTTTYADTGLGLGTTYFYVIRSTSYGWTSASAQEAGTTTSALCPL